MAVNYGALTRAARQTIKDGLYWAPVGLSIAGYVRHAFPDGQWHGDRCGCTDDRCIGYHHDDEIDCGCLPVLLAEYIKETTR